MFHIHVVQCVLFLQGRVGRAAGGAAGRFAGRVTGKIAKGAFDTGIDVNMEMQYR